MSTSLRLKQSTAWLALLTLASAAASADPRDVMQTRSEKVNFADLNLNTLAGASALYSRIEGAARSVCGPDNEPFSHGEFKTCCRTAIAAAIAKVNSPLLTAVHASKQGGPKLAALQSPRPRTE
jgi:UrcA family protein